MDGKIVGGIVGIGGIVALVTLFLLLATVFSDKHQSATTSLPSSAVGPLVPAEQLPQQLGNIRSTATLAEAEQQLQQQLDRMAKSYDEALAKCRDQKWSGTVTYWNYYYGENGGDVTIRCRDKFPGLARKTR